MGVPVPPGKSMDALSRELDALRKDIGSDHIQFCLFQKHSDGRVRWVDEAYCRYLGRPEEEILGRTDFELFPTSFAQKYRDDDMRIMAEKLTFRTFESILRADGERRFIYVVKMPSYDSDGSVDGIIGAFGEALPPSEIEARLHESEERLRTIISTMPVMLSALDTQNRIGFWNHECERVTGYTAAEMIGNPDALHRLYPDATYLQAMIDHLVRGDSPQRDWEWTLTCKDGSQRTVAWSKVDGNLPVAGWATWALGVDVTEKKRALELLEAIRKIQENQIAKASASTLFNQILQDLLRTTHSDYGFIGEISRRSTGETYLKTHAITNISLIKEPSEDDQPNLPTNLQSIFDTVLSSGQPVCTNLPRQDSGNAGTAIEQPQQHPLLGLPLFHDQRMIGMACIANRPCGYDQQIIEFIAPLLATCGTIIHAFQAERERIVQEENRRKLEERFILLARATSDLIWDWELATDRIWLSEGIEQMLGYSITEVEPTGEWWFERIHPDDRERVRSGIREHVEGAHDIRSDEYRFRHKNGSYAIIADRAYILRDADKIAYRMIGGVKDLTEQRKLEEERRRLEAQVQYAQKLESLGVLAGGIAHDFNNLLVSILGHASLALEDLSSTAESRESIQQIETAAMRAADLCKQMLAYSGKGRFVIRRLDLTTLVEEMTQLLQISISKRIVLRYNLDRNLPPIEADSTQIRQIVMNLITNASEACGEKSGLITISSGVMTVDREYLVTTFFDQDLQEGRYVYIEVSDTGCGMDEETRSRIFDPFFTTKATGRGLGMAAVLGIVRGHRGALKCYSELGRGSTFKVLLPAASGEVERPLERKATEPAKSTGTILVVDDEEGVRILAQRVLEKQGFKVLTAKDGRDGVNVYRLFRDEINLVLLDMMMPRLSGEDAFREMHLIREDIPIILSSGYNEQEATNRFVGKGLAGFIQKPYRPSDLIELVNRTLAAGESGS